MLPPPLWYFASSKLWRLNARAIRLAKGSREGCSERWPARSRAVVITKMGVPFHRLFSISYFFRERSSYANELKKSAHVDEDNHSSGSNSACILLVLIYEEKELTNVLPSTCLALV